MLGSNGLKWPVGLAVLGLLAAIFAASAHAESQAVTEGSRAATLESCVADTEDMRRNHMDYLKHQRDEVVHRGFRGSKFKLAECVNCHAAKDEQGHAIPINDEGQFCESCHDYMAVNVTCFQCHRKVPGEE